MVLGDPNRASQPGDGLCAPEASERPQPVDFRKMEKAVAAERKYPLHFTELDELYEQAGVPLEKRIPWFDRNATVVAQGANLNISEHWTDGHILRRRNRYRRQMSKCTRDSARRPPAHSQGKGSI